MTVMVKGTKLVCTDCGGTCPCFTDNYDDVMHLPGCRRIIGLSIWNRHRLLHLTLIYNKCAVTGKLCDTMSNNPFGAECPAKLKLANVLPKDLWRPISLPLLCNTEQIEDCYKRYFAQYEDEVLQLSMQKIVT